MSERDNDFFDDDGSGINPELVPKPPLCLTCKKDDNPAEESLCNQNRMDQRDEESFECFAYEPKTIE